ncbi:MAG: amidohydrolase [Steroidobacteraceae bacterium]
MKTTINARLLALMSVCGLCLTSCASTKGEPADTVLINGRVYTVNPARPWAEAIAIRAGKIVALGSTQDVVRLSGKGTEKIDLAGQFVMPGLIDSHVHPLLGGLKFTGFFIHPDLSTEGVVEKLAAYAAEHTDFPVIVGQGFGYQVDANRKYIDRVISDRPVFVKSFGGHSLWLNSAALSLAHIDRHTSAPADGVIVRDDKTGEPTGLLLDSAMELAEPFLKEEQPGFEEKYAIVREVLGEMSSYGITGAQDAMVLDGDALAVYQMMADKGELPLRIAAAILYSSPNFGTKNQSEVAIELLSGAAAHSSQYVNPRFIKIFLDGVPPAVSLLDPPAAIAAATVEPYYDEPALNALVADMDRRGIGVVAHAHGDKAIRRFLNAVELARRSNPDGPVHHIAHCSMISPDDMPRLQKLRTVCEMSPYLWFPSATADAAAGLLGEALMRRVYPAGMVTRAGGIVAAGSDWAYDNLDLNPFPYLEAFVTRRSPFGKHDGVLGPDQALTLPQAIAVFTINGATAMGSQAVTGSIETGKAADLVVLDQNLFEIEPDRISETRVVMTLMDGRIRFRRSLD